MESTHLSGLDPSRLEVVHKTARRQAPCDAAAFGTSFTDHMLIIEWNSHLGWAAPRIVPYGSLELSPAASVLHYSSTCFEGMKAFRGVDNEIRLFRPQMNMARFNRSAARVGLPEVDGDALLQIICKLVEIDQQFLPNQKGHALYLRPTMIATTADISLIVPRSALLFVIASPVASYYSSGSRAISMETVPEVRAWPGGVGDYKVGPNYAPSIVPYQRAQRNGSQQNLWLIGEDSRVTEATGMNIFAIIERKQGSPPAVGIDRDLNSPVVEMVTPPLDGLILPGVTRDSVLQLARERLESEDFSVSERTLTMTELKEAAEDGRLRELFGTGTAVVILPVRHIKWNDVTISCGLEDGQEIGKYTSQIKTWIENIQLGIEQHRWAMFTQRS